MRAILSLFAVAVVCLAVSAQDAAQDEREKKQFLEFAQKCALKPAELKILTWGKKSAVSKGRPASRELSFSCLAIEEYLGRPVTMSGAKISYDREGAIMSVRIFALDGSIVGWTPKSFRR